MSQNLKLPDDLYNDLKALADKECRTVPLQIQFMVQNWGVEKNKTPNPVWNVFNSSNGVGSQANKEESTPNARSYGELKAEKTKLIAEYQEKINYCQDYDERDRLQHELDEKLAPIQLEIDKMFSK